MLIIADCVYFTVMLGNNHLELAQFQSNPPYNRILVNANVARSVVNSWTEHLNQALHKQQFSDQSQTLFDVLRRSLDALQNANDGHAQYRGKLAIMFINFTLQYGVFFEQVAVKLKRRGIILFIVGIGVAPSLNEIERYRRLAHDTGGDYISKTGAMGPIHIELQNILAGNQIQQVIQFNVHPMQNNVNELNEASDGVGELEFNLH